VVLGETTPFCIKREPIWQHRDGRIIDGRNRWLACQKAGVACKALTFKGGEEDLVAFVLSHNLHRRHLTESQRAMVAANIANLELGSNQHVGKDADGPIGPSSPTVDQAADLLNVSPRSVKRARTVKRHGSPELVQAVERGEISLHKAEGKAREVAASWTVTGPIGPLPGRLGGSIMAQLSQ
jgi:hypothetical protein